MARKRQKFSEEPTIQGPVSRSTPPNIVVPSGDGMWFLVTRDLERNGVHYFPLNHHLMVDGNVPDRVPSMGQKASRVGDNTVPVDKTGLINLAGAPAGDIYSLVENGTVRPVKITKRLQTLLEDGKRASASVVPQMIPPMRRVTNLPQQYHRQTGSQLPGQGSANEAFMAAALRRNPNGL